MCLLTVLANQSHLSVCSLVILFGSIKVTQCFVNSSTETESLLSIEAPEGPYYVNDNIKISCSSKLPERGSSLQWRIETFDSKTIPLDIIDPSFDSVISTQDGIQRTTLIKVPSVNSTGITCVWIKSDGSKSKKTFAIDVREIRTSPHGELLHLPQLCDSVVPQIIVLRYSDPDKTVMRETLQNGTNESVLLDANYEQRFNLACLQYTNSSLKWSVTSGRHAPGPVTILNHLALINWQGERGTSFYKPKCNNLDILSRLRAHSSQDATKGENCLNSPELHSEVMIEVLEVMIAPAKSPTTSVFKCQSDTGSSSVIINIDPVKNKEKETERDKEFLELINVLMQIMQSSNSDSGSGNAPLYGVGFGSSTVMILMALTIYYLKRQLKQLQERVEEGDRLRKKSRAAIREEDDEL